MAKPTPIRTTGPQHFEDLVRRLAYDFRPWTQLEVTGRSGSDDSVLSQIRNKRRVACMPTSRLGNANTKAPVQPRRLLARASQSADFASCS